MTLQEQIATAMRQYLQAQVDLGICDVIPLPPDVSSQVNALQEQMRQLEDKVTGQLLDARDHCDKLEKRIVVLEPRPTPGFAGHRWECRHTNPGSEFPYEIWPKGGGVLCLAQVGTEALADLIVVAPQMLDELTERR